MGNTLLPRIRRELFPYAAWALTLALYRLASFCLACRSRGFGVRTVSVSAVAVVGLAVLSSAVTGWPMPIGLAARLQQRLDVTQQELTTTQNDLRAANVALAKLQAEQIVASENTGLSKGSVDASADNAEIRTALQTAEKQRRATRALYQQALAALARSKKEQEQLAAINLRLGRRLASLEAGDGNLGTPSHGDDSQIAELGRPEQSASEGQGNIPAPFDLRRFLAKLGVRPSGEGGPFVPASSMRHAGGDREAMQLLRSLPLTAPLAHFVVASPFGVRADPINEHEAFHTGVDLDAPYRSPVFNTAPGVVVFAGWAGTYGRMVEIDHGHGIHTRYCHLNRITVTVGEKLRRRVRIGLLGSTGRSTGPHVHYEVRVNGIPVDPEKFLQAGRSVVLVNDDR